MDPIVKIILSNNEKEMCEIMTVEVQKKINLIAESLNPISNTSVPFVIMALEFTSQSLKSAFKEEALIADVFSNFGEHELVFSALPIE